MGSDQKKCKVLLKDVLNYYLIITPHSLILRFKSLVLKIRHCYQIEFNKFVHFKIMLWSFLILNHVFKSTNHNILWY